MATAAKITGSITRWWWVRHAPVPNPEGRCYGQTDKDCDVSNEALFKHQAKLLPKGAGAVFSFEVKGGREAGRKFIESLRIFSHLANVGDAKSLVIHPATTTHYRMSDADLVKAGITAGTVRLSIGLEDPEDLVEDLDRSLRLSQK